MFYNSIPVVMYHHVMPETKELNVTPEIFEDQISGLKRKSWKTLDGEEFLYLMRNPKESRKKCVLLTFDDGFADNYIYAYPILRKYKMKAMLFAATKFIADLDTKRDNFKILPHKEMWRLAHTAIKHEVMCTWDELKEMEHERVFDIQSHGHSHRISEFIVNKDHESVKSDLKESRDLIERYLNKTPLHLAWPKGDYDEDSVEIAISLGFKAFYTTKRGPNINNVTKIKRLPVKCKGKTWLISKLKIYNSFILSKLYLKTRFSI